MYIQGLSTCLAQEICDISSCGPPSSTMLVFCQQALGDRTQDCMPDAGYRSFPYSAQRGNKGSFTEGLGDHYIFHGVESSDPETLGYAGQFAAFITAQGLGQVVAGRRQSNHRYHTAHICQVFIWNPNREAVFAWWNANRPDQPTPTAAQAPVILAEPPVVAIPQAARRPKGAK